MIEIIAVLVIIGIVSAVAVQRSSQDNSETVSGRDTISAHIRYAQVLAMKSGRGCGIRFNRDEYWVFRNNSPGDPVIFPGGDQIFSISRDLGRAREIIYFDTWGSPHTAAGLNAPRATGPIGSLGLTMITDTGFIQ